VKPWCERFTQRIALALIVHFTLIGPIPPHLFPFLSATGCAPTKESWLSRASDGCPVEPRKTKPGSPTPLAFGAGTDLALQSNCIGGVLNGWIAMPQVTLPPSAVQSCASDAEARAGADRQSAQARTSNHNRRIPTSSHDPSRYKFEKTMAKTVCRGSLLLCSQ
jgi:hypothetical protein